MSRELIMLSLLTLKQRAVLRAVQRIGCLGLLVVPSIGCDATKDLLGIDDDEIEVPAPELGVPQSELVFTARAGGSNPPSTNVTVLNTGGGEVSGVIATIAYGSGTTGWLTAALSSTAAPTILTLQARTLMPGAIAQVALQPGSYSASVTITSTTAANSAVIPVRFEVASPEPPTLSPPTVAGSTITLRWSYTWPGGIASSQDAIAIEESNTSPSAGFFPLATVSRSSGQTSRVVTRTTGTYYYRVRAITIIGTTNYSQTYPAIVSSAPVTATRFFNDTPWYVTKLSLNGVSQVPSGFGIAPNNYLQLQLSPGTHAYSATTGFVNYDGSLFDMYTYSGTVTQVTASVHEVHFSNPSIRDLLTRFRPTGVWCGLYALTSTAGIADRCFRFMANGTFTLYDVVNGATSTISSGTYTGTYAPFVVAFTVSYGSQSFEGLLDELNGYFGMYNSPNGFSIQYIYRGP